MPSPLSLVGQTYARLTVLSRDPQNTADGKSRWKCACECGNEVVVSSRGLKKGTTRSCGCLKADMLRSPERKELLDSIRAVSSNHQMSHTNEYRIWQGIKKRCYYERAEGYADYGGRGIRMCDEWKDSFEAFFRDMGPRPSLRHTVERGDSNKNYEPGNCRWATWEEQANNRRNNVFYTYKGVARTLAGWCHKFNLNYRQAYNRRRDGWSIDEIITGKRG